jgi:hypothetical protein
MRYLVSICLTLLLLMFLSACSPVSSPSDSATGAVSPSPTVDSTSEADRPVQRSLGDSTSALSDQLTQRLKSFLAEETGIAPEAIALQQSEPVEWTNACLEVASPEEFCAQVITPGYRVVLDTPQGEYVVHTDQLGQAIRLAQVP